MRIFKKVAIVGTGLIGGSIALAIKKKGLAAQVVGVSRQKKNLDLAIRSGAIDRGSQALDIVKGADLLILATPVNKILALAPKIRRFIDRECLVTDVGSTKAEIVSRLEGIFPCYVGSHPLAGSERRGIINAQPRMFRSSLCVLTPTAKTDKRALKKIKQLWEVLGAKAVITSPQEHDRIISFTSHLPHIVAFSLIDVIPTGYLKFASTGLKDSTRIAASDSELWADIFMSNRRNSLKASRALRKVFLKLESALQRRDRRYLTSFLKKAKAKREKII